MLQVFNKSAPIEQANTKSFSNPNISFIEHLQGGGHYDLAVHLSIEMYKKTSPLFNAIDIRARNFSRVPIQIWSNKESDWVQDHPALDLLKRPNADQTSLEFFEALSSYFDITGNAFLMITGRLSKAPLEIFNIRPQDIQFGTERSTIFPTLPRDIKISDSDGDINTFVIDEIKGLGIRYVSSDQMKEIWHIRKFNPTRSRQSPWGLSRAQPLWMEIQQYLSGNTNNLNQLKRGTRLSMAWVNNRTEELTETQWARMQEEANKYRGENNAGGTPILDGMDVKTIQATNRDMEFKELQASTVSTISMIYGIPLPMITNAAATMNNLGTSNVQLWDNGVTPLTGYLYAELTAFLLPRYDNSEDLEFRFNEMNIPALRSRLLASTKEQAEIGVNSKNELRGEIGYEDLPEGDGLLSGSGSNDSGGSDIPDGGDDSGAAKFVQMMERVKNLDGTRTYTDEYIMGIAREKGLCP
mgnify:FL=1|tara:strand:- start:19958 stop:21364 length:1407 start_codon:yes stop_codon:yes gene_type:complete